MKKKKTHIRKSAILFFKILRTCINQLLSLYLFVRGSFLFKWTKRAIFQLHHGENKLQFDELMIMSVLYYTNTLNGIYIVLVHYNPW